MLAAPRRRLGGGRRRGLPPHLRPARGRARGLLGQAAAPPPSPPNLPTALRLTHPADPDGREIRWPNRFSSGGGRASHPRRAVGAPEARPSPWSLIGNWMRRLGPEGWIGRSRGAKAVRCALREQRAAGPSRRDGASESPPSPQETHPGRPIPVGCPATTCLPFDHGAPPPRPPDLTRIRRPAQQLFRPAGHRQHRRRRPVPGPDGRQPEAGGPRPRYRSRPPVPPCPPRPPSRLRPGGQAACPDLGRLQARSPWDSAEPKVDAQHQLEITLGRLPLGPDPEDWREEGGGLLEEQRTRNAAEWLGCWESVGRITWRVVAGRGPRGPTRRESAQQCARALPGAGPQWRPASPTSRRRCSASLL